MITGDMIILTNNKFSDSKWHNRLRSTTNKFNWRIFNKYFENVKIFFYKCII